MKCNRSSDSTHELYINCNSTFVTQFLTFMIICAIVFVNVYFLILSLLASNHISHSKKFSYLRDLNKYIQVHWSSNVWTCITTNWYDYTLPWKPPCCLDPPSFPFYLSFLWEILSLEKSSLSVSIFSLH